MRTRKRCACGARRLNGDDDLEQAVQGLITAGAQAITAEADPGLFCCDRSQPLMAHLCHAGTPQQRGSYER
jgi:hypothetical protein